MTIKQLLKKQSVNQIPLRQLEEILANTLKTTREFVVAHPEKKVLPAQTAKFKRIISKRLAGEPLQYIFKTAPFYGNEFYVDKRVLIPRPETELLVEKAVDHITCNMEHGTIIDVGTGSGCIIISLAKTLEKQDETIFYASDISKPALTVARKNAERLNVADKIKFVHSNLLNFLMPKNKKEQFTTNYKKLQTINSLLITANLPYLSEKLYSSAPESVTKYEPKTALISGKDGLDHYRKLFSQVDLLKKNNQNLKITMLLEISPEQKSLMEKEIKQHFPFAKSNAAEDLAGKWRIFEISIP